MKKITLSLTYIEIVRNMFSRIYLISFVFGQVQRKKTQNHRAEERKALNVIRVVTTVAETTATKVTNETAHAQNVPDQETDKRPLPRRRKAAESNLRHLQNIPNRRRLLTLGASNLTKKNLITIRMATTTDIKKNQNTLLDIVEARMALMMTVYST